MQQLTNLSRKMRDQSAIQAKAAFHASSSHGPACSYTRFPAKTDAAASPKSVLNSMIAGNARFVSGLCGEWGPNGCPKDNPPALSLVAGAHSAVRAKLAASQEPLMCVVGCADSRVPVEAIFDQCAGDIFTVRIAGSVYAPAAAGSIDYAVKHLGCKVLMILGHTSCGAVKAAQLQRAEICEEPPALAELLLDIKKDLEAPGPEDMVERNVCVNVTKARDNPTIRERIDKGELMVVGAVYDLASGAVKLLDH